MNREEYAPNYIGQKAIELRVVNREEDRRAHHPIEIEGVAIGLAERVGLSPPLDLIIQSPRSSRLGGKAFTATYDTVPTVIVFTPLEGGDYLVRIAERHHNRAYGAVVVTVAGDTNDQ